jgi:MFS family permease
MTWHRDQLPDWVRFVFFGLAPLALLAGILLQVHVERNDRNVLKVQSGRSQAIAAARGYARQLGVPVQDWRAYCVAQPDQDLFHYLQMREEHEGSFARSLAPPVVVQVLFESRGRRVKILLGLDDRLLGYDISGAAKEWSGPMQTDDESLATARAFLDADPRLAEIFHAKPEIALTDRTESAVTRTYTWRAPLRHFRELEIAFTTSVRNGKVLSRIVKGTVDPDFAAHNLHRKDLFVTLFGMGYATFLVAVAAFSLVRYGRRMTQKEVSHSRTLWMALIVSALMLAAIFSSYDDVFLQLSGQNSAFLIPFIFTVMTLALIAAGLLMGAAYGSGEGDVREAYPGKLTSLDALLVGKAFSRNVGASVLVGAAFACWFYFQWQGMRALLGSHSPDELLQSLKFPYVGYAWLSFLLAAPVSALIFAIVGLVQPLAFGTRWIKNTFRRRAFVVFCTVVAASGAVAAKPSLASLCVTVAATVPCLLAPFFVYDLLAALVSFTAMTFLASLTSVAVVYPGWDRMAFWMGALALMTLAVEFAAWRRGRTWCEEEVRPEYARHIVERKDLEAEVAAAREAQLRLLPQEPPAIPGLSIYASCLPARVVGGDFYDFFTLSGGRLGIFIAEGGNRGLASALSIALAKGFLMHVAQGSSSPKEVIVKLEKALGAVLDGVVRATVAYAVVDLSRGVVEYARTGTYPKIVIASRGKGVQSEREIPRVAPNDLPVWEGYGEFGEGDGLVLYTDGVARRISNRSTLLGDDWIQRLASEHRDAAGLHASLFEAIGAGEALLSQSKKAEELDDDLTAVVIQCVSVPAVRLGVVA